MKRNPSSGPMGALACLFLLASLVGPGGASGQVIPWAWPGGGHPPRVGIGGKVGASWLGSGGDLLPFFREEIGLETSDLGSGTVELHLSLQVTGRVEAVVGVETRGRATAGTNSGNDPLRGMPLRQITTLSVRPGLHFGLRAFLFPLGQGLPGPGIESLRWNPFLSLGAGRGRYSLRQWGNYEADGVAFHSTFSTRSDYTHNSLAAGVEAAVSGGPALTLEYRRHNGSHSPGGDFASFRKLDLSGHQLMVGLTYRR